MSGRAEFEFSPEENQGIESLARVMSYTGYALMAFSLVSILDLAHQYLVSEFFLTKWEGVSAFLVTGTGIKLLTLFICPILGSGVLRSAAAFRRVLDTKCRDITELRAALIQLHAVLASLYWLVIALLALGALAIAGFTFSR